MRAHEPQEESSRASWLAVPGWPQVRRPWSQLETRVRARRGSQELSPEVPDGAAGTRCSLGRWVRRPPRLRGDPTLGRCREEPALRCPSNCSAGEPALLASMAGEAGHSLCVACTVGRQGGPDAWSGLRDGDAGQTHRPGCQRCQPGPVALGGDPPRRGLGGGRGSTPSRSASQVVLWQVRGSCRHVGNLLPGGR